MLKPNTTHPNNTICLYLIMIVLKLEKHIKLTQGDNIFTWADSENWVTCIITWLMYRFSKNWTNGWYKQEVIIDQKYTYPKQVNDRKSEALKQWEGRREQNRGLHVLLFKDLTNLQLKLFWLLLVRYLMPGSIMPWSYQGFFLSKFPLRVFCSLGMNIS